jgi:hypothetical protein
LLPVNALTPMPMPVAAMATARVFGCSNAFASHAWSPKAIKAIKARTAYGIRRLGKSST